MSNRSGTYQLYTWDVPTGDLRQLTDRFEGLLYGVISPNGRHVYCFADTKGNEIGHFMRIPFEGGEAEDITPDMPPYPTFGLGLSGRETCLHLPQQQWMNIKCTQSILVRQMLFHLRG